jgi:SAM-dependent methyltransferase
MAVSQVLSNGVGAATMSWMSGLRQRRLQAEVMDQPTLDGKEHIRALRGLERIHWWTNSARILWRPLARLAATGKTPLRVLDLATGGGDIPRRLSRRAARNELALEFAGCDLSARAVEYAQARAEGAGVAVRYFPLDVLNAPLPPDYDVIMCSFFLHHLTEDQAVGLLRRMAAAARRMVLIHDLVRGAGGFLLAYAGTRLMSRSKVVHEDGRKSVEGAFTPEEVRRLAVLAELTGAQVESCFPFRLLLTWSQPPASTDI